MKSPVYVDKPITVDYDVEVKVHRVFAYKRPKLLENWTSRPITNTLSKTNTWYPQKVLKRYNTVFASTSTITNGKTIGHCFMRFILC